MQETLQTNKGLLKTIILTMITFGLYPLYLIHRIARDVNIACKEDGHHTNGLLIYLLLCLITFGIYGILWPIFVLDRQNRYMLKRNLPIRITGGGFVLWSFIGAMIIIGPFVALHRFLHSINDLNYTHNQEISIRESIKSTV